MGLEGTLRIRIVTLYLENMSIPVKIIYCLFQGIGCNQSSTKWLVILLEEWFHFKA